MSTNIFDGINGFALKVISQRVSNNTVTFSAERSEGIVQNEEWVEITKEKNKLPTATLRTYVLYYRNNGDNITTSAPGVGPVVNVSENYRFYNDITSSNGRQLGWIWGFPLFDVSSNANNWPRFNSCLTTTTNDYGNETMLVDISDKQNLIVLDMAKFQKTLVSDYGDGFKDISNNIPGQTDNFYMVLRIKDSAEKSISYAGNSTQGKDGNWNPMITQGNTSIRDTDRWCTLVKYEFYCDIVGPKSFLNFSPSFFSLRDTAQSRLIKAGDSQTDYITYSCDTSDINKYTETITIRIKTGININSRSFSRLMSPGSIVRGLSLHSSPTSSIHRRLRGKEDWNQTSNTYYSYTMIKMIGGWYHLGQSRFSSSRDEGYYGNIQNPGGSRTTKYSQTISWKNDLILKNTNSLNIWPSLDTSNTKNYDLNNILWCSLRSPRKIKVNYIGINPNLLSTHRFITNFNYLENEDSNVSIGGGYANTTNVLDLPRKTWKPYFSSKNTNGTVVNDNTVSIEDFNINNDLNYLDASANNNGNILTLNDINGFTVYYKLLIPPKNSDEYSIRYNFGKQRGSVTTFFRYTDMSGNPNPIGNTNKEAVRDNESIDLSWNKDVDSSGNMPVKSITLIDIASGEDSISSSISSVGFLQDASNNEIYDISTNVFQLLFLNKDINGITDTDRNEEPYTIKTFDIATSETAPNYQYVDISYVPYNYRPYRYINKQDNIELFFFHSNYFQDNPIWFTEERILYNPSKIFPENANNIVNANIIDPSGSSEYPTINIDISGDVIYDNSYAVLPAILTTNEITANAGLDIATFDKQGGKNIFMNDNINVSVNGVAFNENGGGTTINFDEPNQLKLDNYLIPDFWRLPDKINTLRTGADDNVPLTIDDYSYYNSWTNQIQTTMIFDLLSIALKATGGTIDGAKVGHILINTNKSAQNSNQYSAITDNGNLLDNGVNNLVYDVQGAFGIPPSDYLNLKPIVVVLKSTFDGPFGTIGQNYIGNRTSGVGGINVPYPANNGLPRNDSKFIVNTVLLNKFRKGNNEIDGSNLAGTINAYNGIFNIDSIADGTGINQNPSFENTIVSPSPLVTLLVDISSAVQTNPNQIDMINDENNKVTLEWSGFDFNIDPSWNFTNGDIYWTITRYNIQTGKIDTLLNGERIIYNVDKYIFNDTTPVIYSKYRYTVSGVFRWTGITDYITTTQIPSLSVPGFVTQDIIVCKYNRFPYGRYNTTSTNLKLYRPLLLNTPQGQEYPLGNKVAGGVCSTNNDGTGSGLVRSASRVSSSNNIYANTTNQVSKKQTYVILSKSRFRPFR